VGEPLLFDLALPAITLEAGARVDHHVVRGFVWGPGDEREALAERGTLLEASALTAPARALRRSSSELCALAEAAARRPAASLRSATLDPDVPTVLVVHALTGDARCGGPEGFWAPVVGPGEPLDPTRTRVVCLNLLGSCYGSSGPADEGFPSKADDAQYEPAPPRTRGDVPRPDKKLPATITTWDQARSALLALDALGLSRVELVTGGSLGGMVALCLAALAPSRFARVCPIAAMESATSWLLGFNHVGRQCIVADPGFPEAPTRGLSLARQLGMLSYRAEPGLEAAQGRRMASDDGAPRDACAPWSSRRPYRMQTYLEHQGGKLTERFHAGAYLALLDAMDHHDLRRAPPPPGLDESWSLEAPPGVRAVAQPGDASYSGEPGFGLPRITAKMLAVDIDSDLLFFPAQTAAYVERFRALGGEVETATLTSPHGHDAFLLEWEQLRAVLRRALG
jgi:homoserine O-acetyltransferase